MLFHSCANRPELIAPVNSSQAPISEAWASTAQHASPSNAFKIYANIGGTVQRHTSGHIEWGSRKM